MHIDTRSGHSLAAHLDSPEDGTTRGVVVFAHCFTCGKDLRAAREISRALSLLGWAMLRFDFTGLGESEGSFAETGFHSNVEDLVDAVHHAQSSLSVPVILAGHSLGGAAALVAAAECPEVRAVCTIGAPAEPAHVKKLIQCSIEDIEQRGYAEVDIAGRSFTVGREFLRALEKPNMAKVITSLRRPLLLFHSPVDTIVGIDNAATIFQHARHPKSFVSLDTADHLLSKADDARFVADVLAAWAKRFA